MTPIRARYGASGPGSGAGAGAGVGAGAGAGAAFLWFRGFSETAGPLAKSVVASMGCHSESPVC
jgi:hypothetical protein